MADSRKSGSRKSAKAGPAADEPTVAAAAPGNAKPAKGKVPVAPAPEPVPLAPVSEMPAVTAQAPEPPVAEPGAADAPNLAPAAEDPLFLEVTPEEITPEQKATMIADAAYYRAQRRHFAPGYEQEDWYAAEREIEELLAKRGAA